SLQIHFSFRLHFWVDCHTDHPLFYMADILCFTQHVQYEKSGGLVFISDYQGSKLLLSDPQIMTSP
ncbi:unnamed protein product, partial [Mycena citricolor]